MRSLYLTLDGNSGVIAATAVTMKHRRGTEVKMIRMKNSNKY